MYIKNKKFVIEYNQIFILNHKTDFSSAVINLVKSKGIDPHPHRENMKNFFFYRT